MKLFRKEDGFTLVELMVTFLVSSIIMLSATTILLLGIRIMHKSNTTVERQHTTRVLLTALEKLAMDGTISRVKSDPGGWEVQDATEKAIYSFDLETNTVYVGGSTNRVPLLDDVISSDATLENQLLTFSVETETGSYTSSVYCRLPLTRVASDHNGDDAMEAVNNDTFEITGVGQTDGRKAFLKILVSQHGSRGVIKGAGYDNAGTYYSEWYIDGYSQENPTWNESTPWCACYISWALCRGEMENKINPLTKPAEREKWFANVDQFMEYFGESLVSVPHPGDLVFFDWSVDQETNPEHVGVVLTVAQYNGTQYVYTIEGNTSNKVAIRKYPLGDPRIIGYGVLDWIA